MRASHVLLLLLLLLVGPASADDSSVYYVPFVKARIDAVLLPDGTGVETRWESTLEVLNSTSSPASFGILALHGNGSHLSDSTSCQNIVTLGPRTGTNVIPCADAYPDPGVAMLVIEAPQGMLVRADLQKNRLRCGCPGELDCTPFPQGQVYLPVFRGLFPAGSSAVSGPVELGAFSLSESCASANQQYRRRVNITLFNGGDTPATFHIVETPNHTSSDPLFSGEVTVGAKQVVQLNSITVPTEPSNNLRAPNGGNRIWITVTADQPFLSYVSTIFDNPEVGALPFQVFPGSVTH